MFRFVLFCFFLSLWSVCSKNKKIKNNNNNKPSSRFKFIRGNEAKGTTAAEQGQDQGQRRAKRERDDEDHDETRGDQGSAKGSKGQKEEHRSHKKAKTDQHAGAMKKDSKGFVKPHD